MEIILGSQSPRRAQLLEEMGIEARQVNIDCEEDFENLPAKQVAEFLAVKKSNAFKGLLQNQLLITADTTVIFGEKVLNKPADIHEAKAMLKTLSGHMHLVVTGICLRTKQKNFSFSELTKVWFDPINEREIEYYINHFNPMDKAGSYGIQDWIGMNKVQKIEGCYYNVMGLPCAALYRNLKNEFSINPFTF